MPALTPDDIRKNIELQVVELLKAKLAEGKMTEERSMVVSNIVLDTLKPGMTITELYRAIMKMDDACPELSPIVLPFAKQYEEQVTQKATAAVENYIRIGKYDAAINLAQKVTNQEVELTQKTSS
jgi:response regulator RpfG family c-di-GMP phosphodiesterase